jgi:hypothetical protein
VILIISSETKESYTFFIETLTRNPEMQTKYSDKQVEKIYTARMDFKNSLRRDLGFLYKEEKQRRLQSK